MFIEGKFILYLGLKKAADFTLAATALGLLLPLMLLIAMAIKLSDAGPVLFRQGRLGLHGHEFTMYKFRTMVENAEQMGTGLFNYKDDFRVTRVGRVLRVTSLDELPQLINILKGEMSFIGPRPPVTYELGDNRDFSPELKRRFLVRPGITGHAQTRGRNELDWDKKIIYDNQYIDYLKSNGLKTDLLIFLRTVTKVISMEGRYEIKENPT